VFGAQVVSKEGRKKNAFQVIKRFIRAHRKSEILHVKLSMAFSIFWMWDLSLYETPHTPYKSHNLSKSSKRQPEIPPSDHRSYQCQCICGMLLKASPRYHSQKFPLVVRFGTIVASILDVHSIAFESYSGS